ncbi:hypothetical protein KJ975_00970 [Myxococcota bacterium]|nr:hypothetical protein [Myxococcota bacterium]
MMKIPRSSKLFPRATPRVLFFVLALGLLLPACRSNGPRKPAGEKASPGRMVFSLQDENTEEGDTLTTREVWSLPGTGGDLRNLVVTYTRLGKSRTIFSCNNTNAYEVLVVYQLTAEPAADGSWKIMKEEKKHTQAACDGELPKYVGTTLRLAGPDGPGMPYLVHARAGKSRILWSHAPSGSWIYRRSTPTQSEEQKVELELWTLQLLGTDRVTGYYDRMEIRETTNGQTFACNGRKEIVLFTRFTVEGTFQPNGQIKLRETGYSTQSHHPCERTEKRYLDTYSGILIGDTIRLKTRDDDVEQVLNRRHGL